MLEVILENSVGLNLPEDCTFEQWLEVGRSFNRAEDKLRWMIGDWLAFGERRPEWGEKYTEAIKLTGLDYQTVKQCLWVSKSVDMVRRRTNLDWSHHAEVAALDPKRQEQWLGAADKKSLSTRELRASIKAGHVVRTTEIKSAEASNTGIYSPQAVRIMFDRALRQATTHIAVKDWPKAMRNAWKAELAPIGELLAKL